MSLRQLKSTWENLGAVDPLWAVLSDPDRRHGGWDLEEFMATGREQVGWIHDLVAREGLTLGDRVLDFGCGVGRLGNALAERVPEVVGVDIADSMIEQANRLNRHPERLRFLGYDGRTLPFDDDTFDAAVSLIVLQHARPPVQIGCLLELQRVVRPGGVLVLQLASHPRATEPLPAQAMRARIEILDAPDTMTASRGATVRARVTNVSEHTWPVGRLVKLGNHWFDADGTTMRIQDDARADLTHEVAPGAATELELAVNAPPEPGRFQLELDMLQEFVTWWREVGNATARVEVQVLPGEDTPVPAAEPAPAPTPTPDHATDDHATGQASTMEVHGLHTDLVRSLLEHCGSRVVTALPDSMAGADWESYTYLVQRVQ